MLTLNSLRRRESGSGGRDAGSTCTSTGALQLNPIPLQSKPAEVSQIFLQTFQIKLLPRFSLCLLAATQPIFSEVQNYQQERFMVKN